MSEALHRERYLKIIGKTTQTLHNVMRNVSPAQARALRDGASGWTALEVLCHLADFDEIFYDRAVQIRDTDEPALQPRDHEQMVIDGNYNAQELDTVLAQLQTSRKRYIAFFEALTEDQWQRAGIHPERGRFTLTDALAQVATHDNDHIEQLTRILAG